MAKPRIIIADTDISYVIPLQLKVVEDFFEKVDLEIITDKPLKELIFSSFPKIFIARRCSAIILRIHLL